MGVAVKGLGMGCGLAALGLATVGLALAIGAPAFAAEAPAKPGLAAVEAQVRDGAFGPVHEVLVRRSGRTVAEWYFKGVDQRRGQDIGEVVFTPDTLHDVRSVTKSVVSILFGVALDRGAIKNLDQPVLDYFPEHADLRTPERLKVRLRDLLSMTSGLHWDERTYPYTDPRNSEIAMDLAADRYRYVLEQPLDHPAGARWTYSGGDVALAAEVVSRATGKPIEAFAREVLFAPLGITQVEWVKDSHGRPLAASGLRMRPRDMALIGELMLAKGRWRGRQLVSADWVAQSTTFKAQISDDRTCGDQYGYYWWLGALCADGRVTPHFMANGNGGQRIWVIPEQAVVAVSTGGFYNRGDRGATRALLAVIQAGEDAAR